MGPIITPQPTLSTHGLKFVCDVEFTGFEDTFGIIQHNLTLNPAPPFPSTIPCKNPIVIVNVLAMGATTVELVEKFTGDSNSFEVELNGQGFF